MLAATASARASTPDREKSGGPSGAPVSQANPLRPHAPAVSFTGPLSPG